MNEELSEWYLCMLLKHTNHVLRPDLDTSTNRQRYVESAKKMEQKFMPLQSEKDVLKLAKAIHDAGFRGVISFLSLLSRDKPDCTYLAACSHPPITKMERLRDPREDLSVLVYEAIPSFWPISESVRRVRAA